MIDDVPRKAMTADFVQANTARSGPRVLCILPAFNESGKVGKVVEKIRATGLVDQIVVVDDCSTDATGAEFTAVVNSLPVYPGSSRETAANSATSPTSPTSPRSFSRPRAARPGCPRGGPCPRTPRRRRPGR